MLLEALKIVENFDGANGIEVKVLLKDRGFVNFTLESAGLEKLALLAFCGAHMRLACKMLEIDVGDGDAY